MSVILQTTLTDPNTGVKTKHEFTQEMLDAIIKKVDQYIELKENIVRNYHRTANRIKAGATESPGPNTTLARVVSLIDDFNKDAARALGPGIIRLVEGKVIENS